MQATIQLDPHFIEAKVVEEIQRIAIAKQQQVEGIKHISIDMQQMQEITSLSKSTLERYVLSDPRIKQHELHICSKRLWDYDGFKKDFLEIAKANDFTQL